MGSDEESTHEIDIEALRDSLAAARAAPSNENGNEIDGDATVMAPAPVTTRLDRITQAPLTPIDPMAPMRARAPIDITDSVESIDAIDALDSDDVDLADVEDIEEIDEASIDAVALSTDPAPSLIGTLPGHDVAQALRAMLGDDGDDEEPAGWRPQLPSFDDGETQTRLPLTQVSGGLPPDTTGEDDALPAFSLDDSSDDPLEESQGPWPSVQWRDSLRGPPTTLAAATSGEADREATAITRTAGQSQPSRGMGFGADVSETTAVFTGPLPSLARPVPEEPRTDEVEAAVAMAPVDEGDELPRFTLASIPEMAEAAALPEPATANDDVTVMRPSAPDPAELAASSRSFADLTSAGTTRATKTKRSPTQSSSSSSPRSSSRTIRRARPSARPCDRHRRRSPRR
ncbi:MAG: hypothetical protein K0S65_4150 [Labilithrix sp.]|nr:hypothetical protein [Labilithrix sp.]